jgi:hypothetical protein
MDRRRGTEIDLQSLAAGLRHYALTAVLDQRLEMTGAGTGVKDKPVLHQAR